MTRADNIAPWIGALDPHGAPLYLQIVRMIATAVERGALRPGDRLPTQRTLAERLAVDLTTVTRAYAEARQRNLLDAVTGRGSFVSLRQIDSGPAIDLGMNIPPSPRGLRLGDLMQRGLAEVLARSSVDLLMTYQIGAGSRADRAAGCAWLAPLLGPLPPERLLVCAGAQPAIAALLSVLSEPGDTVAAEALTYPGIIAAAAHCRVRVVPVATDAEGVMPEALERVCREQRPRLICLTPTIQNPTAVTMPAARRREIVAIAAAHGLAIIEDDPYSLLAGDAPPPFATLAPELTYYVGTLSKGLTPGLRTAFLVTPPRADSERVAAALRALTLMPAPLMAALVTHWIRDGVAAQVLAGVREEAAARQALAARLLPASAVAHPNGLHVWQPLPPHWDRHRLIQAAAREGLGVTPADAFAVAGAAIPNAVRIALGGVGERQRLVGALTTLAALMADTPRRTPVV